MSICAHELCRPMNGTITTISVRNTAPMTAPT